MGFWADGFWAGSSGGSSSSSTPLSATTANDIITGALRFINSYAPGESLDAADAQDALTTLNDLLDSLSTDQASVYATSDQVFNFTPGQYRYTVGNYDAGQFAGTVTTGSPTITGVTIPDGMIVNGDLNGAGIPVGTTIIAIGATTITMSQNASSSPGIQQISYTIPGDFKMQRPLRVSRSFTRITTQGSGLDYPIEVITQDQYISIGYKGISAPWPIVMWYNPTMPLGELFFYQNPSGGGELHLFSDMILSNLTDLTAQIVMPQGYTRALKRMLGRELAPEYGVPWTAMQERLYKESYDFVKSLNQQPVAVSRYDNALLASNSKAPASWIMSGGFGSFR